MGSNRETINEAGFGRSDAKTVTIPTGNNGGNLGVLDLERNYVYIIIKCADLAGIPASTALTLTVAYDRDDALCTLYERDDPETQWSKTLPTSGSMAFALVHALAVQRLKIGLSKDTTAPVTFTVYGVAQSIQG